ncbi:MAG: stalk domain-containing protein [Dehalobacterium sp.]
MLIILLQIPVVASESLQEQPVVLKINQYYILYMYPAAPFIDESGSLMIPLRSFTELMGGTLTYKPKTHIAQVEIGEKSADINLNQKSITLIKDAAFIKLRTLLNQLNLSSEWDSNNTLLKINQPDLMLHEGIRTFEGMRSSADNENAFDLISFIIKPGPRNYETTLEIKAKNITGSDIGEGKEDLQVGFLFNDNTLSCEPYTKSGHIRKFVGRDQVITQRTVFQHYDKLFAIVALGRTIAN